MTFITRIPEKAGVVVSTYVAHILRLICAGVLVLSVIGKLLAPEPFFLFMENVGLSIDLIRPLFVILIFVESSIGIGLLLKNTIAAYSGIIFFVIMAFLTAYLFVVGGTGSCGCYGNLVASEIGPTKVFQNVVLAGMLSLSLVAE